MRLDVFLTNRYKGEHTRSQITNAIKNGKVTVDEEIITKCGYEVDDCDEIICDMETQPTEDRAEDIPLDIIYQDQYLMVINKPRGMVVHPGAGNKMGTLLNALLWVVRDTQHTTSCGLVRAGIVHRLDKNTAGLMVVAKDAKTQSQLSDMLEKHTIARNYIGIVDGVMQGKGTIDKNIIRDPKHRTLFTTCDKGGRRAITHFEAVENFAKHTVVRFKLETGRTHQIRVHCKAICHPLVGDPEYNPSCKLYSGAQLLESISIAFTHPRTGKQISAEIPTTQLFDDVRKRLTK